MKIDDKIYLSIISYCDELENKGIYKGNSHELVKKLSLLVTISLLSKQQRIIYDVLNAYYPLTTKEIALKCCLESKNVSTQLNQIFKQTSLIRFNILKGKKFKSWFKEKL